MTDLKKIDQKLAIIIGLYSKREISEKAYYQTLFFIADEYLALEKENLSLIILEQIPEDYYLNSLPLDMLQVPELDKVVRRIHRLLTLSGEIDNGIVPTQGLGLA